MAELANCSRCGAVYVKMMRDTCQNCYKEEEKAFQIVYDYLKKQKNREATIPEIVDATGVEEELIIKFVKEKRLRPKDFPMLAYPCERCGRDIAKGKICSHCTEELKQDLAQAEEEEKVKDEQKEKVNIYFTMNKDKR
ncbi:TIGR03826 family flagellar region protein [Oceanobacillus sp. FSL H7-0719]|uniref:TIGR03826 family flagellar region protein n=1 Tax=Oceanobacillus sp. FSL H7-0719 TaxID=2954507 RepID=UPI003255A35C